MYILFASVNFWRALKQNKANQLQNCKKKLFTLTFERRLVGLASISLLSNSKFMSF